MGKRCCLKWVVVSVVSLLVLIQSAHADLMDIGFSISLSIPSNHWTVESGTVEYWLKGAAEYHPETLEIFEQGILSQMFAWYKKSLNFSSDVLMETIGGDTEVFAASLDGTTFYTPITDFGG